MHPSLIDPDRPSAVAARTPNCQLQSASFRTNPRHPAIIKPVSQSGSQSVSFEVHNRGRWVCAGVQCVVYAVCTRDTKPGRPAAAACVNESHRSRCELYGLAGQCRVGGAKHTNGRRRVFSRLLARGACHQNQKLKNLIPADRNALSHQLIPADFGSSSRGSVVRVGRGSG